MRSRFGFCLVSFSIVCHRALCPQGKTEEVSARTATSKGACVLLCGRVGRSNSEDESNQMKPRWRKTRHKSAVCLLVSAPFFFYSSRHEKKRQKGRPVRRDLSRDSVRGVGRGALPPALASFSSGSSPLRSSHRGEARNQRGREGRNAVEDHGGREKNKTKREGDKRKGRKGAIGALWIFVETLPFAASRFLWGSSPFLVFSFFLLTKMKEG